MFITKKELAEIRDNLEVLNKAVSLIMLSEMKEKMKKFEEKDIEVELEKAVAKKLKKQFKK